MSDAERTGKASVRNRATLRDIAHEAGVSTSTVARVLHSNGYVAPATREKVESAMRQRGFRLNAVASGLKRQRTTTIGTVLHETLPNPFFAEVALGIEQGASARGHNVLVYNARGSADHEREGVETLLSQQVQAIVFAKAVDVANVDLALRAGIAVVEVEKPLAASAGAVLVDNYVGARAAMQHLLGLGHEEIGFIGEPSGGDPADRVVDERFAGYRDGLIEAGVAADDSLLALGSYHADESWLSLRTGYDYMSRLLDQHPGLTAVLAASDLLAAGALQALYEREIRVPQDTSVIGFDDTYAKHLAPPLTTVRQPMFEMGARATELALAIAAGDASPATVWLQTELVTRHSTAPPRRRASEAHL